MSDFLRKIKDPVLNSVDRVNSSDHFELVYLRHRYFRKSKNPSPERLSQFEEMICNIANRIYVKNIHIFKIVGFEIDDLRSVGRINTVSFISMGGLKENPDLMDKFVIDHKNKYGKNSEPGPRDVFLRECYNLSKYLNQRLQEVANFCKIKSANIIGDKAKESYFIGTPKTNPSDDDLLLFPDHFEYRKITKTQYKEIAKENNSLNKTKFLTKNGEMIRVVNKGPNYSAAKDFYKNTSDNECNLNPEDLLIRKEILSELKKVSPRKKL